MTISMSELREGDDYIPVRVSGWVNMGRSWGKVGNWESFRARGKFENL